MEKSRNLSPLMNWFNNCLHQHQLVSCYYAFLNLDYYKPIIQRDRYPGKMFLYIMFLDKSQFCQQWQKKLEEKLTQVLIFTQGKSWKAYYSQPKTAPRKLPSKFLLLGIKGLYGRCELNFFKLISPILNLMATKCIHISNFTSENYYYFFLLYIYFL